MHRAPPRPTLFPPTTLSRSVGDAVDGRQRPARRERRHEPPRRLLALAAHDRIDVRLAFQDLAPVDRKSTRLNSSHANISYAVFCLKKKNNEPYDRIRALRDF